YSHQSIAFTHRLSNTTAPSEITPLSLHAALPISRSAAPPERPNRPPPARRRKQPARPPPPPSRSAKPRRPQPPQPAPSASWRRRSEEHTSELQSRENLVCRLLLEKKITLRTTNSY